MKKSKLFLGYAAIFIAAIIAVFPIENPHNSELIVKAISAVKAPREVILFWLNTSYLVVWILKVLSPGALVYLSLIGWEIQCVR